MSLRRAFEDKPKEERQRTQRRQPHTQREREGQSAVQKSLQQKNLENQTTTTSNSSHDNLHAHTVPLAALLPPTHSPIAPSLSLQRPHNNAATNDNEVCPFGTCRV